MKKLVRIVLLSKGAGSGSTLLRLALLLIVGVGVAWVARESLPFVANKFVAILTVFTGLVVLIGAGWAIAKRLPLRWKVIFIIVSVVGMVGLRYVFTITLPKPLTQTPIPLKAIIAPIEQQLADAPAGSDTNALRAVLEEQWYESHAQYYQTTQGNQIIPFDWFRALEQRSTFAALINKTFFASPENLTRYRVLTSATSETNPDGMPIGLPKEIDKITGQFWMGISCASCHSGQFSYNKQLYLVDGAPSLHNFSYSSDMLLALIQTYVAPTKFDRFARRLLEDGYSDVQKVELRKQVKKFIDTQKQGILAEFKGTYKTVEGFGRVDALGRGANGQFMPWDPANRFESDGPVSFPPIWYTHEFDWVQSVAAIQQPMARNMTEAWGVNGKVYNQPYLRFQTSLKPQNLFWMENYLSMIEPPDWPQEIFGKVDLQKVERGKFLYHEMEIESEVPELAPAKLYQQADYYEVVYPSKSRPQRGLCARCHEPQWSKLTDAAIADWAGQYVTNWTEIKEKYESKELIKKFTAKRFVKLKMYGFDALGTDPSDAVNFNARQTSFYQISTGPLADVFAAEQVGVATALQTMTFKQKKTVYDQLKLSLDQKAEWDGYRPNNFRAPLGYPARPLRGYWATAPYLHNGSVPTMYQLLSPASERKKVFYVGDTDYDPVNMGYITRRKHGLSTFDTRKPGNSNRGHEFRSIKPGESAKGVIGPYISPDDRLAIIEYLKVMKDITYTPAKPREPARGDYADDAKYADAQEKYQFDSEYYEYRRSENVRRWTVMENMWFNSATTLFELKKVPSVEPSSKPPAARHSARPAAVSP